MNWKIVLVYCITTALWPAFLMGQDLKQLPGQYSNMVYRQADGKLYALRYSSADNTQYLDRIDPLFARVEEAYPVNAASGILALSDNQAYLYMGTPDSILRYSFASQAVDLRFAHQLNTNQVVYPREIRTLPNQPDAVAVLWNYGYYAETYLALYDQGVRRPKVVSAVYDIATFTTSRDGQYLYGYDAFTTGAAINRMQVTPSGPVLLFEKYHYLSAFLSGMDCLDDCLYGTDGTVVDISQDTNLSLAGRLQIVINQTINQGRMLPFGAGTDTLYFLHAVGNGLYLSRFHRYNFQRFDQRRLAVVPGDFNITGAAVPLDQPHHVAFLQNNKLWIVRTCTPQVVNAPPPQDEIHYYCPGDTLKIIAGGNSADNRYFWSDGFQGKVYVDPQPFNLPKRLSYRIADDQGCLGTPSAPIQVQQVYTQNAPIVYPVDNPVICAGGFATLRALSPNGIDRGGLRFIWSDGQEGQQVRVLVPGAYTCRIIMPQGCTSAESYPVLVTSNAAPQPPQPVVTVESGDGDAVVCSSDNAFLSAPAGFALYAWSDNFLSTDPVRPIDQSARLRLVVQNSAGCASEPSDWLDLKYVRTPDKPTITRGVQVLASSAVLGNQWYLDGAPITGATDQFLTVGQSGVYTVQVQLDAECPSPMSDPIAY